MAEESLPEVTPHAKHDDLTDLRQPSTPSQWFTSSIFAFQPQSDQPAPDTVSEADLHSPRSQVAQRFTSLALRGRDDESGGGVSLTTAASGTPVTTAGPDHRPEQESIPVDQYHTSSDLDIMDVDHDKASLNEPILQPNRFLSEIGSALGAAPLQSIPSVGSPLPPRHATGSAFGRVSKSSNRSRSRKRLGTPPPSTKRKPSATTTAPTMDEDDDEPPPEIVDPVRAALTWQDDEITIYDPEDKDDDGTGINGVGFQPTPAVAAQRARKRKQQLAEYRKREENEARARRNERRRGGQGQRGAAPELKRRHSIVRVHFSEAENYTVLTT